MVKYHFFAVLDTLLVLARRLGGAVLGFSRSNGDTGPTKFCKRYCLPGDIGVFASSTPTPAAASAAAFRVSFRLRFEPFFFFFDLRTTATLGIPQALGELSGMGDGNPMLRCPLSSCPSSGIVSERRGDRRGDTAPPKCNESIEPARVRLRPVRCCRPPCRSLGDVGMRKPLPEAEGDAVIGLSGGLSGNCRVRLTRASTRTGVPGESRGDRLRRFGSSGFGTSSLSCVFLPRRLRGFGVDGEGAATVSPYVECSISSIGPRSSGLSPCFSVSINTLRNSSGSI